MLEPLRALRGELPPPGGRADAAPASGASASTASEAAVLCAACLAPVARAADRIPVDGAATRSFVNPGGLVFEIAAFREAPGCADEGGPSTEWSWFPGCAWVIALCSACGAHLGWRFTGARDFFGLVVGRVLLPPGGPGPA